VWLTAFNHAQTLGLLPHHYFSALLDGLANHMETLKHGYPLFGYRRSLARMRLSSKFEFRAQGSVLVPFFGSVCK
jgi:hypothetical protein